MARRLRLRTISKSRHHLRQLRELTDFRVRFSDLAEAIACENERHAIVVGGIPIALCVADQDRPFETISFE